MKRLLWILPFLAIVALAQTRPGDIANGKRIFMRNGCYQCHGTVGQGGLAGPRLAQTKLTLAGFTAYVRNPAPGSMPPFRAKVMSDQELADAYAYVQSVPPPVPPADIPILNIDTR
ncbi:MAG TPA: cytochrome c [Terriglobia bacterium]|nr:cytochrome c [Terriglobia bacterium]